MKLQVSMDPGPMKAFLESYPKKLGGAMKRALRRVGTSVQGEMIDTARQRGIMRTIFGKKASGARQTAISRGKLRDQGSDIVQPIKIKGFAELQEQGGRTKPHVIRPKKGKFLVIGGRPIFAPEGVKHPGANMPAIPFADRAAQRQAGRLRDEMDKELTKLNAAANRG